MGSGLQLNKKNMEKTKILSWPDFYRDRVRNREYDEYFRKKYARFLTEIILNIKRLSNLMSGEVVLKEEGCGIGSVVKNLSQFYPKLAKELTEEEINENAGDVTKIIFADLDSGILDLCRDNTRFMNLGRYLGKVPRFYTRENILEKKFFEPGTMVVTHGVLEHFSDPDITRILSTYEDSCVSFQAHYVPTSGYRKPSFGDERLLPVDYWSSLVKPDYYIVDNDGLDLYMFKCGEQIKKAV
jgi:hypothetical protein